MSVHFSYQLGCIKALVRQAFGYVCEGVSRDQLRGLDLP